MFVGWVTLQDYGCKTDTWREMVVRKRKPIQPRTLQSTKLATATDLWHEWDKTIKEQVFRSVLMKTMIQGVSNTLVCAFDLKLQGPSILNCCIYNFSPSSCRPSKHHLKPTLEIVSLRKRCLLQRRQQPQRNYGSWGRIWVPAGLRDVTSECKEPFGKMNLQAHLLPWSPKTLDFVLLTLFLYVGMLSSQR